MNWTYSGPLSNKNIEYSVYFRVQTPVNHKGRSGNRKNRTKRRQPVVLTSRQPPSWKQGCHSLVWTLFVSIIICRVCIIFWSDYGKCSIEMCIFNATRLDNKNRQTVKDCTIEDKCLIDASGSFWGSNKVFMYIQRKTIPSDCLPWFMLRN